MTYRQFVPERRLRPFVHAFWTLTGAESTPGFDLILPDGRAELVVHRGDRFRQRLDAGRSCVQASAFVAGQMESAVAIAPGHAVETLGVTFTPCGLAPLCEAPQHALVDRLVDVRDVATPGLRRLVADVSSAPSLPAALELVQRGLARLYESVPLPDSRVQAALAGIVRSGGEVPMHRLHAALGSSPRWLERRFRDQVGISPKRLARLTRFQRALAALVAEPVPSCVQVAAGHGYFDQAHFTAEFHAFTGHAPREFVAGRLDELTRAFAGRAAVSH